MWMAWPIQRRWLCKQKNLVQPPIPQTCSVVLPIAMQSALDDLLSSGFYLVFCLVLFLNVACMNYILRLFGTFCSVSGEKMGGKKHQGYNYDNPLPSYDLHTNLSNIFIWKIFPRKLQYRYSAIIYLYFVLVKLINLSKLLYCYMSLRCFFCITAIWCRQNVFFCLTEFLPRLI